MYSICTMYVTSVLVHVQSCMLMGLCVLLVWLGLPFFTSYIHLCKLACYVFHVHCISMYTVWLLGGEYHLTDTGIVFVPIHCMVRVY